MQFPADVAGVRTDPTRKPLDLSPQSSDPVQLGRAISRISKCLSQANRPAIVLDAEESRAVRKTDTREL
jgi:TPP-dependent 2-oxoacid decarboxylase